MIQMLVDGSAVKPSCLVYSLNQTRIPVSPIDEVLEGKISHDGVSQKPKGASESCKKF